MAPLPLLQSSEPHEAKLAKTHGFGHGSHEDRSDHGRSRHSLAILRSQRLPDTKNMNCTPHPEQPPKITKTLVKQVSG